MSNLIFEGVNAAKTNDETHSLTRQELWDVNCACSIHSESKKVDRQIKAVIVRLTKQSELICT